MAALNWYIVHSNGRRWNRLSGTWAIWLWGTPYPSHKEAEADALAVIARSPDLIGFVDVVEAL